MSSINYNAIVEEAWMSYDASRPIEQITDISAQVSTNHVYKVILKNGQFIIGKLSYFGQYEHFVEDHKIINVLSNNLPFPFENFLSRALMKDEGLFVHRYTDQHVDAWVVFYRPIRSKEKPPRKLNMDQIEILAAEFARFHKACYDVRHTLPVSSKKMSSDINHLLRSINYTSTDYRLHEYYDSINKHCLLFKESQANTDLTQLTRIPVFVDWNIGNFSVNKEFLLYSRWDYDWFRMSTRLIDFYFFSRIVSEAGDRTVFSYLIDPLNGDHFIHFLQVYHEINPLNRTEVLFLKEVYRFFILHYVVHFGHYFFRNRYASKLQKEAFTTYLPSIENFDPKKILKALNL